MAAAGNGKAASNAAFFVVRRLARAVRQAGRC